MGRKKRPSSIVRIEVDSDAEGVAVCRNIATQEIVRIESHPLLSVGATHTVEMVAGALVFEVVRVLDPPPSPLKAPVITGTSSTSDAPVLVNGRPFSGGSDPGDLHLGVGDVRTAFVRFTSNRTGERDRGREGKRRPVVVVAIDDEAGTAQVCPIHGTNSVVRTSGGGRRLLGWQELGLRKSSVVAARRVIVPIEHLGDLIGRLSSKDRCRLGMTP